MSFYLATYFVYFFLVFMLILGYVRVRLAPQGYGRGLVRAPQGL